MRDDISVQGLVQANISIVLFFLAIFVELGHSVANFFNVQFAENYARKGTVRLKEIFTPGTLQVPKTHNQLKELESVHKVIGPKFFLDTVRYLSVHIQHSTPSYTFSTCF